MKILFALFMLLKYIKVKQCEFSEISQAIIASWDTCGKVRERERTHSLVLTLLLAATAPPDTVAYRSASSTRHL